MYYSKQVAVNGVVCEHHKITEAKLSDDGLNMRVLLSSWATEQSRLNGDTAVGQSFVLIPVPGLMTAFNQALAQSELFSGASVVPDASQSLDALKQRRRVALVTACADEELSTFTMNGVPFNCNAAARRRITEAAIRATRTTSGFTRNWPRADGTVVTLTKAQVLALFDALDDFTVGLSSKLQSKLAEVEAAQDPADVEAVAWA